MPDMAAAVPYEAYAPNPVLRNGQTLQPSVPGTIARGALPLHFGATPAEAERAGRELPNPLTPSPALRQRGAHLYATFCAVCHGDRGGGDGPIIPKFPTPPSYTSDRLLRMADGQIFHTVTYGTSLMPPYGTQILPADRWALVLYVRHLQGAAAEGAP